jgi:hypothetical protein
MLPSDPPGICSLYLHFFEILRNFSREPTLVASRVHSNGAPDFGQEARCANQRLFCLYPIAPGESVLALL